MNVIVKKFFGEIVFGIKVLLWLAIGLILLAGLAFMVWQSGHIPGLNSALQQSQSQGSGGETINVPPGHNLSDETITVNGEMVSPGRLGLVNETIRVMYVNNYTVGLSALEETPVSLEFFYQGEKVAQNDTVASTALIHINATKVFDEVRIYKK